MHSKMKHVPIKYRIIWEQVVEKNIIVECQLHSSSAIAPSGPSPSMARRATMPFKSLIGTFSPHRFSSVRSLFLNFSEDRNSRPRYSRYQPFGFSTFDTRGTETPIHTCDLNRPHLSLHSGFSCYRDLALSRLHCLQVPTLGPPTPDTRDAERLRLVISLPRDFTTCEIK
jgi:hypothetical protein